MAGEEAGAAAEKDKLEQIQPPRWSPTSKSCCTRMEMVLGKAAGSFFSSVMVAELGAASIFNGDLPSCASCIAAATGTALARLPPFALGPDWRAWRRCRSRAEFTFLSE